ncbi:hypothetical protein GCM10010360_75750 [Streptomyces nogalater]
MYGIPYLEPSMVRTQFEAEAASHRAVLTAALDKIHADLTDRRPAGTRSVVLAHAFVTPGTGQSEEDRVEESASERDISVGGVAYVGADVFDGIDYVALGHLHCHPGPAHPRRPPRSTPRRPPNLPPHHARRGPRRLAALRPSHPG